MNHLNLHGTDDEDTNGITCLSQLLPDNVVDPMELLSYLDPPDLATPPSSGASSNGNMGTPTTHTSDDILALFE